MSDKETIIKSIYDTIKQNTIKIIESYSKQETTDVVFLTFLTAQIIKSVETTVLKGQDKKDVAIQIGRLLIKDSIKDELKEQQILIIYDALVGPLIDQLVDVASNVNIHSNQSVDKPKACCTIM